MDAKLKHLEMIQGVINRMAANSFMLKRWSVILVAALFALAGPNRNPWFIHVAYLPVLMFWALDGYFLRQERLFRALYDSVRRKREERIDFSMDTRNFAEGEKSWLGVCMSETLRIFHLSMLFTLLLVTLILKFGL